VFQYYCSLFKWARSALCFLEICVNGKELSSSINKKKVQIFNGVREEGNKKEVRKGKQGKKNLKRVLRYNTVVYTSA